MSEQPKIQAHAAITPLFDADSPNAVYISTGRALISMTIAEARELSLALARAADDAEMKLPK